MIDDGDQLRDFLTAADAEAVDAVLGGQPPAGGAKADRTVRLRALLSVLDTPVTIDPSSRSTLIDVTMARVLRAGGETLRLSVEEHADDELSVLDAEALDAYVAAGYRASRTPAALRPRAERIDAMVRLVGETPLPAVGPSAALVERTLAAINRAAAARPAAMPAFRPSGGFRLADLVSVAAVLMIGTSIAWPVMSAVRSQTRHAACAAGLGGIASAMGVYAGDYGDALPMATASLGGSTWWDVGKAPERSNSVNIFTLAKNDYATVRDLACAGNPKALKRCSDTTQDWGCLDEVSYSYYVMFGRERPTWRGSPQTVVLADRSPVVLRASRGETIYDMENSPNHGGRGQWALRADGSTAWLPTPMHGSDNIWLPKGIEDALRDAKARIAGHVRDQVRAGTLNPNATVTGTITIRGNEIPASEDDSLVGP